MYAICVKGGHQEWLVVIGEVNQWNKVIFKNHIKVATKRFFFFIDVIQFKEENKKKGGKFDGVGECYKSYVVWQNVAKLGSYLT